jgi:hypothetical protein
VSRFSEIKHRSNIERQTFTHKEPHPARLRRRRRSRVPRALFFIREYLPIFRVYPVFLPSRFGKLARYRDILNTDINGLTGLSILQGVRKASKKSETTKWLREVFVDQVRRRNMPTPEVTNATVTVTLRVFHHHHLKSTSLPLTAIFVYALKTRRNVSMG